MRDLAPGVKDSSGRDVFGPDYFEEDLGLIWQDPPGRAITEAMVTHALKNVTFDVDEGVGIPRPGAYDGATS